MKLFIKLLLFTVVLAVGAPFLLKDEDGRPLLDASKLRMPELGTPPMPDLSRLEEAVEDTRRKLSRLGEESREEMGAVVYRWRDAQGNWHFSDDPPDGVASERVTLDPAANVVRLQTASGGTATDAPPAGSATLSNPVRLMEQARGVDRLAQERLQRQEQALQ